MPGSYKYAQAAIEAQTRAKMDELDISDKYLPGILIGYISSVNTTSDNLTKSGYLMPAADFYHLEEVLVVTQLKQQITE